MISKFEEIQEYFNLINDQEEDNNAFLLQDYTIKPLSGISQ